jgi:hypothetical protein
VLQDIARLLAVAAQAVDRNNDIARREPCNALSAEGDARGRRQSAHWHTGTPAASAALLATTLTMGRPVLANANGASAGTGLWEQTELVEYDEAGEGGGGGEGGGEG